MTRVDICICTFQRPQIVETLTSVAQIDVPDGVAVRVIIADNDDTPTAQGAVAAVSMPFELAYVHAPSRNISIARNACLDAATADFVVFIDDDESVEPNWFSALLNKQRETGAEVVLGPALALYPEDAPDWLREGDYHSSTATYVDGEIRTAYTCNVLIERTAPPIEGKRFRLELGKTGGEDTVFFAEIYRDGGRFAYAPEARVSEPVEHKRLGLKWLLQRKIRFGQTHALTVLELQNGGILARLKLAMLASLKLTFSLGMALVSILSPGGWRKWLIRGALHAGVVSKCFGAQERASYG